MNESRIIRRRLARPAPFQAFLLAALIATALVAGAIPAYAEDRGVAAAAASLAAWAAATPHPGVAAALVDASGILWSGAFGLADIESKTPMNADSVVPIGSVTKSLTALAVLQLALEGRLGLDDPVTKHLPWFRLADKSTSDRITLRHCLNNMSGIPSRDDWLTTSGALEEAEIERGIRALDAVRSRGNPGTSFEYANENWSILGLVIAEASGLGYAEYLEERILGPLGMDATTTRLDRLAGSASIPGCWFEPEGFSTAERRWKAAALPAGSCLVSTARDMGAYLSALLASGRSPITGRRVIAEEAFALLWEPAQRFAAFPEDAKGGDAESRYAMGWIVAEIEGRRIVFHGGNTGRSSTMVMLDPADGRGVAILMNSPGELDRYRYDTSVQAAKRALDLMAGRTTSDWGAPTRTDPRLVEAFVDPGEAWLAAIAPNWISADGRSLSFRRDGNGPSLVARYESSLDRTGYRVRFLDRGRVVLSNPGGTTAGRFALGADGSPREFVGPGGLSFKPLSVATGRFRPIAVAGGAAVLPQEWEIEEVTASGAFSARLALPSGSAVAILRGGVVPGVSPGTSREGKRAAVLAAAGLPELEARRERINAAWSGGHFWESEVFLPDTQGDESAHEIAFCECPGGLLWFYLQAPSRALSSLNREALRPLMGALRFP